MDLNAFWEIIEDSRSVIDLHTPHGNMARQEARLRANLEKLEPHDLEEFARLFTTLSFQAYRWDIWAAAWLINGGCSDDGFLDFRDWMISLGRDAFENALKNPDSLAEWVDHPSVEVCMFEGFGYVAQSVNGEPFTYSIPHPKRPAGERWARDRKTFQERLPNLSRRCANYLPP